MTSRIAEYIAQEQLLVPQERVIVGLSGGADSVALLAVLTDLGYECVACHCNFMLRGEESVRDRNHAEEIARRLNVKFAETTFATTDYARQEGISIEMAARQLRYEWFEKMRIEHRAQAIAVAHHRDDNAETLLLNLTRGTGLAGLTGISARNGHIVRPMLCVSREEIIDYLTHKQLPYVTDSTNLEAIYTRNKLRLEVIPLLRQINPAF
ncbi:MAG: tRNA lysidine(34) synthetase TilS, partial [Bacteroidaceae bacterium]|nr:tRNA lysidine(34) synthetase TilS [Bacteroidaceae bacterium]